VPAFPQILAAQPTCAAGLSVAYFDPNFQLPAVHQTDLTVEREIARNTVVSMSYLGSFGRSLPDFVDTNTGDPATIVTYKVNGGGPLTSATYATPLYATITTTPPGGTPTTTHLRPISSLGATSKIFSGITSNYNALAVQLNRRMTQHLQLMASYTWSHSLDFGQNASTFSDTNDLLVPSSIKPEYGNSIFNVPNRFVANAVIESPWKVGGALGYLTNDWQLSPIYASQSGLPYSLVTSGTPAYTVVDPATGVKTAYGALGGGVNGSNGRKGIDIIGRNTFQMKRTIDMDLRLSKKVRFTERFAAEVLGEAFNIFNHQNVTSVNTTGYILGSTTDAAGNVSPTLNFNSSFGKVTNSNSNFAYTSRQVQIGFRFLF